MTKLFFWNNWKKPYKNLYISFLSLLGITILVYLYGLIFGVNHILNWDVITQFDTAPVSVQKFTDLLLEFSIDASSYLSKERFITKNIEVIPLWGNIYLLITAICICLMLTVITRLELTLFAVGMGVFIFLVILLNLDQLGILGHSKKLALAIIILYGALGFYFQAYDEKLSFIQRFLSFLFLTLLFAIIISLGSRVQNPFFHLANYGIIIPIILSLVFILSISFDIIAGFLYISSGKISTRNSVFHFIFISVLYFINLLLIFLKKKGVIEGELFVLNVFIIYLASTILGIWGLQKRSTLFSNILAVSYASFLYMSFAILTTATIAYAYVTGNDPMVAMFEYAILYSHMGIGLIFFLYILYNFWELFEKNIPAYDLMLKPRRMPFFMVRPVGIVIIISLLFQSNRVPVKHGQAGYYNLLGDVYLSDNKLEEAKEQYNEGAIYSKGNIKSNFSMLTVLKQLGKESLAEEFLTNTLQRKPTEFAFANLSNLYLQNDKFFYAWFAVKEGLQKFPESGQLHNNMAMLYSTKGIWDSSFYHLDQAKKYLNQKEVANTNMLWLLLKLNLPKEADSVATNFQSNYISYQTNKFVSNLINNKAITSAAVDENLLGKDSILNIITYAYLYNGILSNLNSQDTSILGKVNFFSQYEGNIQFYFEMSFLKSLKLYYSGNRKAAIDLLNQLSKTSSHTNNFYYQKILGLWALDMGNYPEAARTFNTDNLLDAEAQLFKGIALLKADYISDGLQLIHNLTKTPDNGIRDIATKITKAYDIKSVSQLAQEEDEVKYYFIQYRKYFVSEQDLLNLIQQFKDPAFKTKALLDLIDYYLFKNEIDKARQQLDAMLKTNKDKSINQLLSFKNLRILEKEQRWKELLAETPKADLNESQTIFKSYFLAVANMNIGKTKEATSLFNKALQITPMFDSTYIKAAQLETKLGNIDKAYGILVEGIRFNPVSPEILKAYILTALQMNLTSYSEETLSQLKEIVSPKEFAVFNGQYQKAKAEAELKFQQY